MTPASISGAEPASAIGTDRVAVPEVCAEVTISPESVLVSIVIAPEALTSRFADARVTVCPAPLRDCSTSG